MISSITSLPALSSSIGESFARGAGVSPGGIHALLASIGVAVALVVFAYVALGLLDMIEHGDRDDLSRVPWLWLRMAVLVFILIAVFVA